MKWKDFYFLTLSLFTLPIGFTDELCLRYSNYVTGDMSLFVGNTSTYISFSTTELLFIISCAAFHTPHYSMLYKAIVKTTIIEVITDIVFIIIILVGWEMQLVSLQLALSC